MIRIALMALLVGSTAGITIGSFFKGFNVEGVLIGMIAILSIVAITFYFYIHEKRQFAKTH